MAALSCGAVLSGCGPNSGEEHIAGVQVELNKDQRRTRAEQIRNAAAEAGLDNALLLTGIASAETGMAHCWSEATWACQGPDSADCAGGPVIAGAADGPCSAQQGGLGMFQFDAGTYQQTLARDGQGVLTVAGNTQHAIDFVANIVQKSVYIEGVGTRDEAVAWMNQVRAYNELWKPWIQTVTHYYNGCVPGSCSIYNTRFNNYSDRGTELITEMGAEFWYGHAPGCGPIPADGAVLDETDYCFGAGGAPTTWRHVAGKGYDGELLWTYATDAGDADNYAFWELNLAEAGSYKLEVYADPAYGVSHQAGYALVHAGATEHLKLDQSAGDGWKELGTFQFAAGAEQSLRLGDNTGDPLDSQIMISADAVRLTRVSEQTPTEPPDPGIPMQPMQPGAGGASGVAGMPATAAAGTPAVAAAGSAGSAAVAAAPSAGVNADAGCGCRLTAGRGSGAPAAALLGLVALVGLRRRRQRAA